MCSYILNKSLENTNVFPRVLQMIVRLILICKYLIIGLVHINNRLDRFKISVQHAGQVIPFCRRSLQAIQTTARYPQHTSCAGPRG